MSISYKHSTRVLATKVLDPLASSSVPISAKLLSTLTKGRLYVR